MRLGVKVARGAIVMGFAAALGACSHMGSLGGVLGSVLSPQPMEVSATVRSVDTHVAELRRKLEANAAEPRHILTVRKSGYRIAMP